MRKCKDCGGVNLYGTVWVPVNKGTLEDADKGSFDRDVDYDDARPDNVYWFYCVDCQATHQYGKFRYR